MDIIERLFHLSPDGGSGLFEWSLFLLGFSIIAMSLLKWRRSQSRNS
jgi:hypothetical protein